MGTDTCRTCKHYRFLHGRVGRCMAHVLPVTRDGKAVHCFHPMTDEDSVCEVYEMAPPMPDVPLTPLKLAVEEDWS